MQYRQYPFTAIVGQEPMRLALLLNAVDPRIGGVLIRGEKGTAKSTMARALAELLPQLRVVAGCPFGCDPDPAGERCDAHRDAALALPFATRPMRVIELPANATEDRLAGTIDIQTVLKTGEARFEPGLLAAANRGILYVDEVNLLPDHLVDLLLDAAAMGRNTVEREGISLAHPARFVLIGTMNPEEGDLRPQLLDRFGLCVDVTGLAEVSARVEVMRRRAAHEADPAAFAAVWDAEQRRLRGCLIAAHDLLPAVTASDDMLTLIAGLSLEMGVDGHRADLAILRAARALAALEGRTDVARGDVQRAAALALPHRMRRNPFEQERFSDEKLHETLDRLDPPPDGEPGSPDGEPESSSSAPPPSADAGGPEPAPRSEAQSPQIQEAGEPVALPTLDGASDRRARGGAGRRQRTIAADGRGRFVRAALPNGPTSDIALSATLRAAAAHPPAPGSATAIEVRAADIRARVRERKVGASVIFLVDASGSMAARKRMAAAKGAALSLLTDAYQRRDRVALIAFRGSSAETLLPLTDSVQLVQRRLEQLPAGGRTPLAAGLQAGLDLLRQVRLKDPHAICVPVLITDGKANVSLHGGAPVAEAVELAAAYRQPGVHPLVLDTEGGYLNLGLAARLAERAGARYVRLGDPSAQGIAASVRSITAG